MVHRTREPWHAMKPGEVEKSLRTNIERGLSHKVCRTRLERFGKNGLFTPVPRTVQGCIRKILTEPSLLVLAVVCLVALFFARWATALTVLFVLAVGCAVSIVAYVKTSRIKESISERCAPRVRVLRGGNETFCNASDVVPGDVLLLEKGDVVPCDARLVDSTSDFCVLTYIWDEDGKSSYVATHKNAAEIYDATSHEPPLKRVNMVYAAAVVHRGSARAIVTETGEDTYIAAFLGSHPLAMQVGEPTYLGPMRKYMNRYSLVMCALVLPVTLIGILAGRGRLDILDVLLLMLSLVASTMSEQVISLGRIICATSIVRASLGSKQEDAALIKNYHSIDELSRMDELLLYGRSAVSDGKLHPYAAYTAEGLQLGQDVHSDAVRDLYEMLYFYEHCSEREEFADRFVDDPAWRDGIHELGDELGFDHVSADIRTVVLRPLEYSSAWVEVVLRQGLNEPDRHFRIHRCEQPEPLLQCNARRLGDRTVPLDTEQCKMLFDIFCRLKNQGTEVRAYIREEGGLAVFEGILSFREAFAPDIPEMLRQMEKNHVRVSLFLPEEGQYHLNYLIASGWIDSGKDAVSASKLRAAGKKISDVFDKKRVFFGFSEDEVAEQIAVSRTAGKTVACFGIGHRASPMSLPADISIGCEMPEDATSPCASDEYNAAVNRHADVLIRRAGPGGGGLAGIACAISTARSIHFRMMLAMQYLLVAQLLRVTMVVLPMLFGYAMISPALLLISGVWVDLAYVLICAFHHCSPDVLREAPDYHRFFKAPLRARPDWLCATLVCGFFTVLSAWVLMGTATTPVGEGLEIYMFLSLLLAQTCLLVCLLRSTGVPSARWRSYVSSLLVIGALMCLILPILLIPPVGAWFGGRGLSLLTLLLSLLSPLFLIGCYFLSMTYRKKIRRMFRVYFHGIKRRLGKNRNRRAYTEDKSSEEEK